jgi:hypothetical protein
MLSIKGGFKMNYFQIGLPQRKAIPLNPRGIKFAKSIIKRLNGVTNLYRTIYNFSDSHINWRVAIIDKLFFDFDVDEEGKELEHARKMHEYLLERNLKHTIFFSGRGFHIYLFTKETHASELQNPIVAVKNAHREIVKLADVEVDPVTTDLMRISRIQNTVNIKSGLFCIPLTGDELYRSKGEIMHMARNQRNVEQDLSGNLLSLEEYDREAGLYEFAETEPIPIENEFLEKMLPSCVLNLLSKGDCVRDERYLIITAMRDNLVSREDVRKTLKTYLTEKKYKHCVFEEDQVNYLYDNEHLLFKNCETIQQDGFCVENCNEKFVYL